MTASKNKDKSPREILDENWYKDLANLMIYIQENFLK